jgi:hypothetical protein
MGLESNHRPSKYEAENGPHRHYFNIINYGLIPKCTAVWHTCFIQISNRDKAETVMIMWRTNDNNATQEIHRNLSIYYSSTWWWPVVIRSLALYSVQQWYATRGQAGSLPVAPDVFPNRLHLCLPVRIKATLRNYLVNLTGLVKFSKLKSYRPFSCIVRG